MNNLPTKEIAQYKSKILRIQQAATALNVSTVKDMETGTELLVTIKGVKKMLLERKEAITRPLMQGLASVRDLFKPLETGHAEAEKVIKEKMLAYQVEENDRVMREKERIEKRVAKGTMRADTAVSKLENLAGADGKYESSSGKVGTRTITKVRIIDETIIPREFLVPDMIKITEAVIRHKLAVPGVETYNEKILVTNRN